ncbi:penicillin-binding protein 1C [Leptospira sp. 96542]|nr:penicillin-binding protein 1C [Leptospira sp. 96542]
MKIKYLIIFCCFFMFAYSLSAVPSYAEVKKNYKPSDVTILASNGEIIQKLRIISKYRSEQWLNYDEAPSFYWDTVLYAEDRDFYHHTGVDSIALLKSLWKGMTGSPIRGASTISMQLVSFFDEEIKPSQYKRSVFQKIKQIQRAVELEETWTKKEILEAYTNLVYFRGELRGLSAASKALFLKHPSALSQNEVYVLVSLIRSPQAPIQKVMERACRLKKELDQTADCESVNLTTKEALFRNLDYVQFPSYIPHAAKKIVSLTPDDVIQTTISLPLQLGVEEILYRNVLGLKEKNVNDGAVLVLDNKTGSVLAYVGNVKNLSLVPYIDLILTKRQAGSTLKPFVYAQNFEEKKLTPVSLLSDSPIGIPDYQGTYRPLNYDKTYRGEVTVKESLGSSLNIPAIRALSFLDINYFVNSMKTLGFSNLQYAEFYGPSLALGTADVSLWELTNAYRTLANDGRFSNVNFFPNQIPEWKHIYRPTVSYMVSYILSDREARSLGFGWDNFLSTTYYSSVKTGTSQDMRDNWCIGYSEHYTVGVWIGNPTGDPMLDVSGITGAAPVWRETMDLLHENKTSFLKTPPPGLIWLESKRSYVEMDSLNNEKQIYGKDKHTIVRIVSPTNKSIYALDPDIPNGKQKILFTLSSYSDTYTFHLNGKFLANAKEPFFWAPIKGDYRLQILDSHGNLVSEVLFEVR